MPPARSTVAVRNLPELTTEADIKTFFDTRVKHADTRVFPLVCDTQRAAGKFKCTTVELNHKERRKVLKLNQENFLPAAGGQTARIEIDDALTGAVTLASHNNPQYEYVQFVFFFFFFFLFFSLQLMLNSLYFVHGVGGNVFGSWVNDLTWHMWPRDSFPEQSINSGLRGRFSTIGYDAKVLDGGEPKTIQAAAEAIMSYVRADRPQVSFQDINQGAGG
jgi:hypothetical protein